MEKQSSYDPLYRGLQLNAAKINSVSFGVRRLVGAFVLAKSALA